VFFVERSFFFPSALVIGYLWVVVEFSSFAGGFDVGC
jgi:hypothetical protein